MYADQSGEFVFGYWDIKGVAGSHNIYIFLYSPIHVWELLSLRNIQKQIRSQSATQSTRSETHCLTIPKTPVGEADYCHICSCYIQ